MTGLMYIVVTPDGERTILGHRGANMLTDPAQIPQEDVQQAELLHLSGYALLSEPQRSAALFTLATARTHGVSVTLDPGMSLPRDALNELRTLLPVLDVLMPNHIEAQRLTGATSPTHCAERLLEAGVAAVALKLGRDGCLIGDAEGLTYIPAFAVDACDSTGAGDAFAAGIIAGCVGDLSWPSVGTLGNALGAMAASRVGADMPVPTAQELLELLYRYADRELPEPIEHAAQETMTFVERLMRRPEEEGKRWWK
jgi:ribokinase